MGNPAEKQAGSAPKQESLPERFWSLARGMEVEAGADPNPAEVVKHVLAVLDAFERGETADKDVSLRTLSFLKLLREAELRGEISYAAPEQIRGESVDERSLVFSVGVLLFERLTGRHPYGAEGNRPRRLARMQKGEFGSGVNYFPHVPPGLRRILMRAMGPFPEERWSTLKDMREHLEDFLAHEDDGVRLPGTAPSSRKKTAGAKSRKPAYESQPTRVVDMSERVKMEREAIARRRARDGDKASSADAASEEKQATDAPERAGPAAAAAPRKEAAGETRVADAADVRPRLFGSAAPLVWALIGAAAASVVFMLFLRPESPAAATRAPASGEATSPTAESAAAAAEAAAEPAASPAAAPRKEAAGSPSVAAAPRPAPAAGQAPVAAPKSPAIEDSPAVAPVKASFDPQLVGELALDAAWSCFDEASRRHGLMFGAGLLVDATDGHVRKVYFAGNEELTAAQRSCFRNKMAEFKVRTPPARNQVVDYQYRIHGEQRTVKVRAP